MMNLLWTEFDTVLSISSIISALLEGKIPKNLHISIKLDPLLLNVRCISMRRSNISGVGLLFAHILKSETKLKGEKPEPKKICSFPELLAKADITWFAFFFR